MIYALSYALDSIEAELVGVTRNHAKWVALVSAMVGKTYGMSFESLSDLAGCAALHDNALVQNYGRHFDRNDPDSLRQHCISGQQNIANFPFHGDVTGIILYHHENIDGSGAFGKQGDKIPLPAQIIHLVDMLDVNCDLKQISVERYEKIMAYLAVNRGKMFKGDAIDHLLQTLTLERYLSMKEQNIDQLIEDELPHEMREYPFQAIKNFVDVFGKIVDEKSTFTKNHSFQVADKAVRMGKRYGYDQPTLERLYVAASLHDIGKMSISNDVLEKPDKLTADEYVYMQNHAWYTWAILKQIKGFDDITNWAALHHEKLNGKGYPFGKTAAELNQKERLMACVDIYQALREDRPYKLGMTHEKSLAIMRSMAASGLIDPDITEDMDQEFRNDPPRTV